jgi:membrane fusion protein, multidrug efflux system
MIKRRTLVGLIILAVAALACVIIIRLAKSKAEEGEEIATDVAVHVGKITRATLHRIVTAYGTVEPEPARAGRLPAHVHVAAPVAGIVAHVDCVEGQKVAQGTLLFRLDNRVAEVAYEKAKRALAFARENFERQKKLLAVGGTSQKSYLEAESQLNAARSELAAAETDLALLKVQATLAGTVLNINVEPGEAVEPNTVLATIVDLNRLVATLNIPSREAAAVKIGQLAQFETGRPTFGRVVYFGSKVDDKNDTVLVRASIPADTGFRPGQFLTVKIICEEHANCLAVPEAAAVSDTVGGEAGVIVLVEGNKAIRKPVKIGLREAGLAEVEGEGLREGMIIVTEDAYAIPGETKIHIVN